VGSWLEKGNESVRVVDEFHCGEERRGEAPLSCCTIQYTAENRFRFSAQFTVLNGRLNPPMLEQTALNKLCTAPVFY